MKKYIAKLHYLTQDLDDRSHIEQVKIACEAGAKWIQYRCLSKTDEEMLDELKIIGEICDDWGATLIITNHVHLVNLADIQGVHIEDMDADISLVRAQLGDSKTIGASATHISQIKKHIKNGVDYIGCGPFAHTDTKPNDCKHWGIYGYQAAVLELKENDLHTPLIAAGGIGLTDVTELLKTGIHGVAISAAINKTDNPSEVYKEIHRLVY